MDNTVFEKAIVVKLFHNPNLQKAYLPDLLPGIFHDRSLRLVAFTMQQLYLKEKKVSVENMVLVQNSRVVKTFMSKYNIKKILTEEQVTDLVYNVEVDSSETLFEEAYKELHDIAFARVVEKAVEDFSYNLGYNNRHGILARAKAILKVYNIIYRSKHHNKKDGIGSAISASKKKNAYLRVFTTSLSSLVGGWSRGYIGGLIGRPSHGKSTFMTKDSLWQIKRNSLNRVDAISPEESEEIFWQRVISMELNVPLNKLREGLIQVSSGEEQRIRELYEGKLFFHEVKTLTEVMDLINTLKSQYIWIDHINGLAYPNDNMYQGIIKLINFQKDYLRQNKDTVMVDLSQVNTKKMLDKGRLFPRKEDAYNSSALEHACREIHSIYYPYRDAISPETQKYLHANKKMYNFSYKKDEIILSVEKNSYGELALLNYKYIPETGNFIDQSTGVPEAVLPNSKDKKPSGDIFDDLFLED